MTAIELKNKLHQMIDDLEEQQVLNVYDYVHTQYTEYVDPIDELNDAQHAELEEAIEQSKNGEMTSHEDFKKEFAEWFTK